MKFELNHRVSWDEAKALAADGWELVSVVPGAGFYFKRLIPAIEIKVNADLWEPIPRKKRKS